MSAARILAVLTVRDEGAFLIDWLAHHRATGFTDFLVFSNDCSDGTDAMLDRLQAMGWLTHLPNPGPHGNGPQWAALRQAEGHPLRRAADWIAVIDIDEYVNIHAGDRTVPALLAAVPGATAIAMTWRLFGNAGIVDYRDQPVTAQFVRAAPHDLHWPWRAALFKTLFRNDGTYRRLGVHRPRDPDPARIEAARWVDGAGRPLPPAFRRGRIFSELGQDNHGLVQLNHYALGAMESYVVKVGRGRANRAAEPFDMSYWIDRNFVTEEDRTIQGIEERSAPLRAALRADPVLGPLHEAAVRWRRQRFADLMRDERVRALFARLMMAPPSRVLPGRAVALLHAHAARAAAGARRSTEASSAGD
ncbi:MAG: glycosyltransferase family 2 protein [Rhodobacteraceae bacterium]|nr:glycosyltransferase family 2 protein [Paracoccaceae bacterium]